MSGVSLSNVLLPAVFVSSAVFSTLTVPFALIKNEPIVIELPPFFSGEIPPLFDGEHKDVAIPYIGFAIVVSVGAGMATVEVNRRWQAYREALSCQKPSANFQANLSENAEKLAEQELPEYRPEVSALDLSSKASGLLSQSLTAPDILTEVQDMAVESHEPSLDSIQLVTPQLKSAQKTRASTSFEETLSLPQLSNGNHSVQLPVTTPVVSMPEGLDLDSALNKLLKSREQYQTCRLKMPHLKQRLWAIEVNGQYYSFFRVESTKEKVEEIIALMSHKVQEMVVTQTERGYVIWASNKLAHLTEPLKSLE